MLPLLPQSKKRKPSNKLEIGQMRLVNRSEPGIMDGCTVLAPTAQHTHTIIFLHGRGSTAKEFQSEFFESESDGRTLPQIYPQLKWVFPNAPIVRAVRFGQDWTQWFDMCKTPFISDETKHPGVPGQSPYSW
jgi:hypothetical protein